jgi:hypothetical protein
VDLECRRDGGRVVLRASDASATYVLRVHHVEAPASVTADGRPLSRLEAEALDPADQGWTVDGRVVIVKARARELRLG